MGEWVSSRLGVAVFNWLENAQTAILLVLSAIKSFLWSFFVLSENPHDPRWIQSILRSRFAHIPPISELEKSPKTLHGGGVIGLLYCIDLRYNKRDSSAGYPRSLIVKQVKYDLRSRLYSRRSGFAREALFYRILASKHAILSSSVPEVYYSHGSFLTGKYMIVMEDLKDQAVPSGLLLGNQCWDYVPVPVELEMLPMDDVVRTAFLKMADIHAAFWRSQALLEMDWLKGARWRTGKGKWRWEVAISNMLTNWKRALSNEAFTPRMTEIVETLIRGTTWIRWRNLTDPRSPNIPFSLVHGDFHANNVLFMVKDRDPRVAFVDWSEVGIGCPFSELAQFMISNATVEFRREHERKLFESYHARLVARGVDGARFTVAESWERYKGGGIERWLMILILLVNNGGFPQSALSWFGRQVEAFVEDHGSSVPGCFLSIYA